jgi:hypothetical protein
MSSTTPLSSLANVSIPELETLLGEGNCVKEDTLQVLTKTDNLAGTTKTTVKMEVEPCASTTSSASGWKWMGMLVLWFIIFTVIFWIIFYSLQPSFVMNENKTVDTSMVLLGAIISALILVIIIALIKWAVARK